MSHQQSTRAQYRVTREVKQASGDRESCKAYCGNLRIAHELQDTLAAIRRSSTKRQTKPILGERGVKTECYSGRSASCAEAEAGPAAAEEIEPVFYPFRPSASASAVKTDHPRGAGFDPVFSMLTDMSPSAGAQFYGAQIPAMGMNITNITTHMQKPSGRGPRDRTVPFQVDCLLTCSLKSLQSRTSVKTSGRR
ncbi:hypothetical protein ZHAS_00000617 [Anopheles sinensis]|uniref:Uncharacterized protein n=1 Tax=Anopheles sinensis TaxID=74873 RepID=A0A084VAD7_ANOSI|nr:hypothetical protein ZHAS_00000617 [Anopheles sinensis]